MRDHGDKDEMRADEIIWHFKEVKALSKELSKSSEEKIYTKTDVKLMILSAFKMPRTGDANIKQEDKMTEQERAAALADPTKIAFDGLARIARMVDSEKQGELASITLDKMDAAIRALAARPAVPEPVAKAVERIIYEHRAWIAMPNREIAEKVALAAVIAAHTIISKEQEDARPAAPEDLREVVAKGIYLSHPRYYMDGYRMFERVPFEDLDEIERQSEVNSADTAIFAIQAHGYEVVQAGTVLDAGRLRAAINYATDKYDGDAIEWLRACNYDDPGAMAELDRAAKGGEA